MAARLLFPLLLLVLSSVSTPATAAEPGLADAKAQKAAVKCQKAIGQTGAKLFAGRLKSLDACSTAVLACIQLKPGDAKCLTKATGKCSKALVDGIPRAEVAAAAKIVKSCGTPLRTADLLATDGLGIGARAASCNGDFGLNVCSGVAAVAQCLVAEQARGAERTFATEQPRASELIDEVLSPSPLLHLPAFPGCQDCSQSPSETLGKAVAACGATLTKAGRTFAGAVQKGLGACIDKVFACVQTKPGDAKCRAKATAACNATVAKLAAARAKLTATVDKKCADTGLLPFATLAAAAALNLDALADDCAALGVGPLGGLADYVACVRRQHECRVAEVVRSTSTRTAELLDAGLLGDAGPLLDPEACPATLPSDEVKSAARNAAAGSRIGSFPISRFFGVVKKSGTGAGSKATTVGASLPGASPNAVRRISFPLGTPRRFVPGSSQVFTVKWGTLAKNARAARVGAVPPMMVVGVKRGDLVVDDHLEIPLDDPPAGADGEVELEIQYAGDPPSCAFDLAFAIDEDGELSEYTEIETVSDTVPPATPTPAPQPTATAASTVNPTVTSTSGGAVTPTQTANGGATPTLTPSATAATPTPTPLPVFAYALTTTDDTTAPGRTASLILTVTNLSNALQNATMSFTVPNFTTYGGFGAGSVRNVAFTNVAPGASESAIIPLLVTSAAAAPPDDTLITVTFSDSARGASVTRTFRTDATPSATLTVSTADATVAPGGTFTYALGFHNAELGPLDSVFLAVAIPAGATFVAAEGDVTLGPDDTVNFALGALAGGATGQRTITFAATAGARAPLVVAAELTGGGIGTLARASMATTVYANPALAYSLTSIDDAPAPGRVALFRLTVTNLTNGSQDATLAFRVPDFTTYGGFGAGSVRSVAFGSLPAGASESALLPFVSTTAAAAPPDGTLIDVAAVDGARGVTVSRAVVADATPAAELALTTEEGTVAAGGAFAYTLAFDNPAIGPLVDTELSARVPAGAGFVAASEGVTPDVDGVVRWQLGTLAGNSSDVRTVWLTAPPTGRAPVVLESALRNATTGEVVTQASAATTVQETPAFSYTLTTTDDAVGPGGVATFRVTVTNLTNAPQGATLAFRVPDYTTYGGFGAGNVRSVVFDSVAAGATQSALLPFVVTNGAAAPPDGTVIAVAVDDGARGATVSRSIVTRSAPPGELTLATTAGTIAPGATFAHTLHFGNPRNEDLPAVELAVRVPTGAAFVAADEGVTPDADGFVRWPIGTLAGHASGERTVVFTAAADARSPLVVDADVHDGTTHAVLTRASAATAVDANPAFTYTLTSTDDDPVAPGRVATFIYTVTNRTNAAQSVTAIFRVPNFTTYAGFGAGNTRSATLSNIPAGGSASAILPFVVTSAAAAPPDGTLIGLLVDDAARAGAVSRAVVARASGVAELKVSTAQGTVAPGGAFAYTLSFHNPRATELAGAELVLPVPAGATFVSADGGVTPDADGVVSFPLGTLAGFAGGTRTIQLTANATATAPILVDAEIDDADGEVIATASGATAV